MQEDAVAGVLVVRLTGELTEQDLQRFVPQAEQMVQRHGRIRVLVDMHEFAGCGGVWERTSGGFEHFGDVERLALVGESQWQDCLSNFCRPFTSAEIRYFPRERIDEARHWIEEE